MNKESEKEEQMKLLKAMLMLSSIRLLPELEETDVFVFKAVGIEGCTITQLKEKAEKSLKKKTKNPEKAIEEGIQRLLEAEYIEIVYTVKEEEEHYAINFEKEVKPFVLVKKR